MGCRLFKGLNLFWRILSRFTLGSNFSISALLLHHHPPLRGSFDTFPFVMCVFLVLCFQFFFSFLFYSWIIFSYLAPCCLPPSPPARCFYSEALTQKKKGTYESSAAFLSYSYTLAPRSPCEPTSSSVIGWLCSRSASVTHCDLTYLGQKWNG